MSSINRMSRVTLNLVVTAPPQFQALIRSTAAGTNPHVTFPFVELKIIRGTHPHPPNTDREEVRNSIMVQFNGTPHGPIVAHLFNDGTIKTSIQMHEENNARRDSERHLKAEEDKYPELHQTPARQQAHARMMQRIMAARLSSSSIIQKQIEKSNAQQEYQQFLQAQSQARARAHAQVQARGRGPAGRGRGH